MAKLTSQGEAWQGDWQARLAAELGRRASGSLREFVAVNGCVTYEEIAAALQGPFVPIQMVFAMRAEFAAAGDWSGFVADCLFRYLRQYTLAPATNRKRREQQASSAVGACTAALPTGMDDDFSGVLQVWRMLKERILDGWLPSSPKDPLLAEAVDAWDRWFGGPSRRKG
jgi:hypothetical protein